MTFETDIDVTLEEIEIMQYGTTMDRHWDSSVPTGKMISAPRNLWRAGKPQRALRCAARGV